MFSLHVVQAQFGDALLVQSGTAADPRFMLVDGGPEGVFDGALKEVLAQIVKPHGARLERVVLTHVDTDHVIGLVDLLTALLEERANGEPESVAIAGLWLNSFASSLDPHHDLETRVRALAAVAGVRSAMANAAPSLLGVGDGNKLRQLALQLGIPLNAGLADPVTVDSVQNPVTLGALEITVVGPTQANLAALRQEWIAWLDEHEARIADGDPQVMANADKSVPNLSSICLLARSEGRTMLLTGDARSDHILDGLGAKGMLDASNGAHFDLLKVPHHGSDRNITKSFFRAITAEHYVLSANGKYGNPDIATLTWLVEAAKEQGRTPTLHVTNETPSTRELLNEYPRDVYGYKLEILPTSELSLEIPLA